MSLTSSDSDDSSSSSSEWSMASAAAAKVELDMMFCVVFAFRCVFGAGENSVCLLRFGVNGSFYLNTKKISLCRLVQNLTSLLTSSVQAPYMFHTSTTYRRCQKIDNVDTL